MLFNSVEFLLFFPIVAVLYFLLPHRFRWQWLLLASCAFYMAFKPEYIFLCAAVIVTDYLCGLGIAHFKGGWRKFFLVFAIISALGLLFFYKYLDFANYSLARALQYAGIAYSPPELDIILPIGLSFLTFQSLGYVLDVYRGTQKPERNLGVFATFVMFFPQLVAGPIERAGNLLSQFREKHSFSAAQLSYGLRYMLWGFFKKMVIADQLSVLVNKVYNNPAESGSFAFILATVAFAFQIYCDFSGYSDIARGSAAVLGFRIMKNFDKPYFSKSISEFWRRWHISLSSYFRDYVYIPLGGNRKGRARTYVNLMITFLLSGLWHGASWTFVIWGGLNGLLQIIGALTKKLRAKLCRITHFDNVGWPASFIRVAVTFTMVCFTWIFFRANSMTDAIYIITHLIPADFAAGMATLSGLHLFWTAIFAGIPVLILIAVSYFGSRDCAVRRMFYSLRSVRFFCYILLAVMILGLGVSEIEAPFVYFQF